MPDVNPLDDVAQRLMEEAGRILTAEGPAGLNLRRLAAAAGTSTMAVYTRFGDKHGLLAAMHAEGFRRLGKALREAAPEGADSLTTLGAMGMAYRQVALTMPHLYDLMFGPPPGEFAPDEAGSAVAEAAYHPLLEAVQTCLDDGTLAEADAATIAYHLWAVSHGFVSLEIAGQAKIPPAGAEAAYRDAMIRAVAPFLG